MSGQDFLEVVQERGFVHQLTDAAGLAEKLREAPVAGYIGFDATADSLHVGSLVQIMLLRWLARTGNRPVVLIGGGTTQIGDPSGRDEVRQILTLDRIEDNKKGIFKVFTPFLEFGTERDKALVVDNADWLEGLRYIPFLREVGRHFSVNRMLTMDSVRLRLDRDQPLSFIEFNYMLLQSYDFVELFRRHGVTLQMGGSDQWGNIVLGADLVRRMEGADAFGLTTPLVTTATGAKMGKTAQGAVWLDPDRTSPYDYWQFWRNTGDAAVGRFLALFTELPMPEVRRLAALTGAGLNEAKKVLATEATALLHGRPAAKQAAETARRAFEAGETDESLPSISYPLPASLAELLVAAGLCGSKGEARRLVAQNGVRLDDRAVDDASLMVTAPAKLSVGRKRHVLVR
jgi:tyrosyl-tRNA synthetase